jgi:drug/metabolite transporter (DMT)-like permease
MINFGSLPSWLSQIVKVGFGGPKARTYALVAGAVILWASWPALATLVYPVPPFLVLGLSAFIGFVFSYIVAATQGQSRSFFSVSKGTMLFVAVGLMGNNAFYLAAISRIGPAEANVVHYLWPVFLVALAALVHRRKPTLIQMLGIAAGFTGVVIAIAPKMGSSLDVFGVLLGICGALTFAIYSVVRSFAPTGGNVVGPSLGLAAVIALLFHLSLEQSYWPTVGQWMAIAMMGIGPFTLANILWDKATRSGSAATISSLAFLTPLVAISLLAIFGLGVVTLTTVIGALFAIVGAVMASRS